MQDRDALVKCSRRHFFDKSSPQETASSIVCQDFEGCAGWHDLVLFPHVFPQRPGIAAGLQ